MECTCSTDFKRINKSSLLSMRKGSLLTVVATGSGGKKLHTIEDSTHIVLYILVPRHAWSGEEYLVNTIHKLVHSPHSAMWRRY